VSSHAKTSAEESSGNIYADVGHPDPELAAMKSGIAYKIQEIIHDRGLTQAQAAKLIGVDQPKVSEVLRGKLRGYTLERLLHWTRKLGQDVTIVSRK